MRLKESFVYLNPIRSGRDIQLLDASEIPPIRTEFIEELGQGAFGRVKKAKLTDGLQYFANEQDWAHSYGEERIVAVKELHGECEVLEMIFICQMKFISDKGSSQKKCNSSI